MWKKKSYDTDTCSLYVTSYPDPAELNSPKKENTKPERMNKFFIFYNDYSFDFLHLPANLKSFNQL
jgi:hypothetical protein